MASSPSLFDQSTATAAGQEYLVITVNQQLFAINAKDVNELIEQPNVQFLPNAPAFTRGVLNLRGEILSVLDLQDALYGTAQSRKTSPNDPTKVGVILNIHQECYCFLVSNVRGIFNLRHSQLTSEFPFIPRLHSISAIRAISLAPLDDPETEEIVEIIDLETLFTNCQAEWNQIPLEERIKEDLPGSKRLPQRVEKTRLEVTEGYEYLVISLNDHFYGVVADQVVELIEQPKLQSLPKTPDFIAGVINHRSEILSAVYLKTALYGTASMTQHASRKRVGVILDLEKERVCFLVPEVYGVFTLRQHQLTEKFPFIPGLYKTSAISAIALAPLSDPETNEIIELIDSKILFSNCQEEWQRMHSDLPLWTPPSSIPGLLDEGTSSDSLFEQQERLRKLKLDDYLLIQINDSNFGIPLPFVHRAFLSSVVQINKSDNPPVIGWMTHEGTQIPVIDPREVLFNIKSPSLQRTMDYTVLSITSDQVKLAIVMDKLQAVTKASLVDPKDFGDTLKQFGRLNRTLIENAAHTPLDEKMPPFPIIKIPEMVKSLLNNENVIKSLNRLAKLNKEMKEKGNSSKNAKTPEKSKNKKTEGTQ